MQEDWQTRNLKAIDGRLLPVRSAPDGILYHNPDSANDILVYKSGGVLYLYFHAALDAEVQSRLALDAPLHLLSPYSQMVMLALLWNPEPRRVYVIGFGGGRIPMLLHHHLPQAEIHCSEIDREVVDVAKRFFGVAEDARLRIAVRDGRDMLAAHDEAAPYDIIVVDAFIGLGAGPRKFATYEFFQLCRQKLSPDGVVVVNLLDNDPGTPQKCQTLVESFPQVFGIYDADRGNRVMFGCNREGMAVEALRERAAKWQEKRGLSFSPVELAALLAPMPRPALGLSAMRGILRDEAPQGTPKLGRNDVCYCGSGKKYKKCHG